MKALLDTHAFLWWITDDPRLSDGARRVISDPGSQVFFSAASAWEIAIKAGLGRLKIEGDLARFIPEQLTQNSFQPLPIGLSHALHVHKLPQLHRDPFDHLLVAQAMLEGMPLISSDPVIARYPVEVIW